MVSQHEYLGEWRTIEEIKEYLLNIKCDEGTIKEIILDVLKYAKVRYLVERQEANKKEGK